MQMGRWERLVPLTGVVAVALVLAGFLVPGDTPSTHATAQKVQAFYSSHTTRVAIGAFLLALAVPFLVFFASTLHRVVRFAGSRGRLAAAALGGGVLSATGFAVAGAVGLALADAGDKTASVGATQPLHVLSEDLFIPFVAGLGVMVLATGLATVRYGGVLPRLLGWIGVVIGVAIFIPIVGFFAFALCGLWIIATSIVLFQRGSLMAEGPAVSERQM